jgi:CheY-like chemotaxis protein
VDSRPEQRPILLVEDDPADVEAIVRTLHRVGRKGPVLRCADGDEALDFLRGRGKYADADTPAPALVLLDLNLPGTDGRAVLSEIKSDEELRCLPVVVMTSSKDERDVRWCYEAGANSYILKSLDGERFVDAIQSLQHYWFEVAVLPMHAAPRA